MRKLLFLLILTCGFLSGHAQNKPQPYTLLFYNLENLFDTINDPQKNDEDFLPTSTVSWNTKRYFQKLDHLSKAMIAADSVNYPAIIGVAEAENKKVLQDLITFTPLKKKKYDVILEEGPDPRGIDVGIIYRKDLFKTAGIRAFRGADSFDGRFILYTKLIKGKDTLHVFVNHWKSRTGGTAETAPMRMESAVILKKLTDSLLTRNPHCNILIMGDLNDEPTDASLTTGLQAIAPQKTIADNKLYNLMASLLSKGEGTLYYKDWDIFDQIIVSGNLLDQKSKGSKVTSPDGNIVKKSWMLYQNKQGVMVPNRTESSKEYFGGYSDHLPVYTVIR